MPILPFTPKDFIRLAGAKIGSPKFPKQAGFVRGKSERQAGARDVHSKEKKTGDWLASTASPDGYKLTTSVRVSLFPTPTKS